MVLAVKLPMTYLSPGQIDTDRKNVTKQSHIHIFRLNDNDTLVLQC